VVDLDNTSSLSQRLLAADEGSLAEMLGSTSEKELLATLAELGRDRRVESADALVRLEVLSASRSVRKEARRQLHRLSGVGVQPGISPAGLAPAPDHPAEPLLHDESGWVTDFDGHGARTVWLMGERRLGGASVAGVVISDLIGILDIDVHETTRKRFLRWMEGVSPESQWVWVEAPYDYVRGLVREALETSREQGTKVPSEYAQVVKLFGEAESPPERALIYDTIGLTEVTFHPEWLEESGELRDTPEVGRWAFENADRFKERALDLARATPSGLVVPGNSPQDKAWGLLRDAAAELLGDHERRALQRRLEETAYVFVKQDRLREARLAVASARALADRQVPLLKQPVILNMLALTLALAVHGQALEGRDATLAVLQLVSELIDAGEPQASVATSASGLILPR
jgi:hypothetical protein